MAKKGQQLSPPHPCPPPSTAGKGAGFKKLWGWTSMYPTLSFCKTEAETQKGDKLAPLPGVLTWGILVIYGILDSLCILSSHSVLEI